ncbi:MAG: hypothetical protein ACAH89_01445 [Rariglobus sp.]|nr:hypothetical protein [Rariglobus sp.]
MKIRDFPAILVLLFSVIASFAMGCSGGGSNTPGGGGGGSGIPSGNAPTALASGMVFTFTGEYNRLDPSTSVTWIGNINKTLNVTSPTVGTSLDNVQSTTGTSNLTYTRNTPDLARIVATNYPYIGPEASDQRGTIELQLTFSTPTSGTFVEQGIGLPTAYAGAGTFTFSSGVIVTP